jgi:hypothetical protein
VLGIPATCSTNALHPVEWSILCCHPLGGDFQAIAGFGVIVAAAAEKHSGDNGGQNHRRPGPSGTSLVAAFTATPGANHRGAQRTRQPPISPGLIGQLLAVRGSRIDHHAILDVFLDDVRHAGQMVLIADMSPRPSSVHPLMDGLEFCGVIEKEHALVGA